MSFLFDLHGDDDETGQSDAPEIQASAAGKGRRIAKAKVEQSDDVPVAPLKRNPQSSEDAISISELTARIKSVVEKSFPRVWVTGEMTDIARPRSGHLYFTLKDEDATIRGVMWRSVAESLPFDLEDGVHVICLGDVEVYPARGSYQLIVRKCQPEGMGALQLAFMQLQNKLTAEGLFDPNRKRPIPTLPRRIAIVTSPSGAAIHDFLQAASARHEGVEIVIIPASVQGPGSVDSLVAGIAAAHRLRPRPDVLIVARGGGSLEDLWSFNEERLVRALAKSQIPTVSAVGHEVDVTLADMVADLRALTPTDAASRVLPDRASVLQFLKAVEKSMIRHLRQRVRMLKHQLDAIDSRVVMRRPHEMVRLREREIDELDTQARLAIWKLHRQAKSKLETLAAEQSALSPLKVLSRGYSVTLTQDGHVLRSTKQAVAGQTIRTRLGDGEIASTVR